MRRWAKDEGVVDVLQLHAVHQHRRSKLRCRVGGG